MKKRIPYLFIFFALIMAFSLAASLVAFATVNPGENITEATDTTAVADDTTTSETAPPARELLTFKILASADAKKDYLEGESFDPTGYTLEVSYTDGSKAIVPSNEIVYSPAGALSSADQKITITYMDMSRTTPVSVSAFKELKVSASKTDYLALEFFDPSTLTVNIVFDDNSEKTIPFSDCSFSPALTSPLSSSTKSVELSYTYLGKTIKGTLDINVKPIVSIEISGLENTKFYECEYFAPPASMVVTAYYDAEKTISAIIEPEIPEAENLLAPGADGKATLTAVGDGVEQAFTIDVVALTKIDVDMGSTPTKYYYGEKFSPKAIKVTATYADETSRDISANVVYTYPEVIAHGSTITASVGTHEVALPVTLPVGTLLIVRQPTKTEYLAGEQFDKSGLFIGLQYNDGSDNKILTSDLYTIADTELLDGMEYVVAEYYGATVEIPVVVGNKTAYTSISITQIPTHLTYISGQTLNTEGLIVHAYMDGDSVGQLINIEDLIFSPSLDTLLTSADKSFTVKFKIGVDKYLEASCPISVEEKVISNITVTKQPLKTEYKEGDKFDNTGMEVSLVFNDGTTTPITNYTMSNTSFVLSENGENPVKLHLDITYGEYSCTVTVSVTPAKVNKLTLVASPIKSTYYVGEIFDPEGLKIIVMYDDDTLSAIVPDGAYTIYPAGALDTETKKVVVSFRGLEVNVPITVIDPNAPESSETEPPVIDPPTPDNSSEVTTAPIVPPVSSETDEITTSAPTDPSDITTLPTPDDHTTNEPDDITTNGGTGGNGGGNGGNNMILIMWIVIIAIIVVALVVLIIYYKRNFT